ncbi:hypothetical protein [Streptomyces chartreusis]
MRDIHEITLGDVTVTRIEEMHGPIMPTDQFFPDLPEQAWKDHRDTLIPDHLKRTTPWSTSPCGPGCCAARAAPSSSTPASATTSPARPSLRGTT